MVKNLFLAAGTLTLVACVSGCVRTQIQRGPLSPEEQAWEDILRENYPGYRPPPKTSRSVQGHTEERVSSVVRKPLKPMDDPVAKPAELPIDPAAEDTEPEKIADIPENTADNSSAAEEAKTDNKDLPAAEEAKDEKSVPAAEEVKTEEQKTADADAKTDIKADAGSAKPAPPDPTNSIVYVVRSGDTLGGIAQKQYGSASFSNVIFKANTDILKDANTLRPGMKLIIPKL